MTKTKAVTIFDATVNHDIEDKDNNKPVPATMAARWECEAVTQGGLF